MSPVAFICETPDDKTEDLRSLGGILEDMGYEVHRSRDFCHPLGQKIMSENLEPGESAILVCKRRLEKNVFERILYPRTTFFSYSMEGEPGKLAARIGSDVDSGLSKTEISRPRLQNVMVIGGGVAGVYAALDVAEQGYPVSLVECDPSIGGIMAALDKTFPTMDCSI